MKEGIEHNRSMCSVSTPKGQARHGPEYVGANPTVQTKFWRGKSIGDEDGPENRGGFKPLGVRLPLSPPKFIKLKMGRNMTKKKQEQTEEDFQAKCAKIPKGIRISEIPKENIFYNGGDISVSTLDFIYNKFIEDRDKKPTVLWLSCHDYDFLNLFLGRGFVKRYLWDDVRVKTHPFSDFRAMFCDGDAYAVVIVGEHTK